MQSIALYKGENDLFYQKKAYKPANTIMRAKAPTLKVGEVAKIPSSNSMPLSSSLSLFSRTLTKAITAMDKRAVNPIWSRKGRVGKRSSKPDPLAQPLGPTLKNRAIGMEANAP